MLMPLDSFRDLDRLARQLWNGVLPAPAVPIDAYRDGDHYVIHFDLPGVDPGSIELTVQDNVLTVKAARTWTAKDGPDTVASERVQGTFGRQLFLGDELDADHIQARYENGVLTVTIPIAQPAKARRVEISSSDGAQPAKVKAAAA